MLSYFPLQVDSSNQLGMSHIHIDLSKSKYKINYSLWENYHIIVN